MTLKSEETNQSKKSFTNKRLNEIFKENKITSENIVKIFPHTDEVIVIWDDGDRPI